MMCMWKALCMIYAYKRELAVVCAFLNLCTEHHISTTLMSRRSHRYTVSDEPVEFEKLIGSSSKPLDKWAIILEEFLEYILNQQRKTERHQQVTNWLDLQTLGSWPILSKTSPDPTTTHGTSSRSHENRQVLFLLKLDNGFCPNEWRWWMRPPELQSYVHNERWENCKWTTILDFAKFLIVQDVCSGIHMLLVIR